MDKLRWLGKSRNGRKTEMGTGCPDGRCWDCKSDSLMLRWGPGKQGCGQQTLEETAGEKAAWFTRGQTPPQVGYGTFPSRNKPKIVQSHHSSDILTQSTACPASFLCCISANSLPLPLRFLRQLKSVYRIQLSLGTAPVSQGCNPTVVFYCFFQKVPDENISLKKHNVKMLPAVLN